MRAEDRAQIGACRAFTLLELLVAIGIICVLAGLLLAAMARAKQRAWTIQCLNNMRQLQIAWFAYATDNRGVVPPCGYNDWTGLTPTWVRGYMGYATMPQTASESTNWALLLEPGVGRLGPYVGSPGPYKCPADRDLAPVLGKLVCRVRSCSLNWFLDGLGINPVAFSRVADITHPAPSEVWAFTDEHADTICGPAFEIDIALQPGLDSNIPAARHQRGAGLSFADGHVARKEWKDRRTLRPVVGRWPAGQPANVDNPDFRWLYRHARRPDPKYP